MSKKIIAISGGISRENGVKRANISQNYIDAVVASGHSPLILPIMQDEEAIEAALRVCDGLIMTGGVDINPLYYNQPVHRLCGELDDERDTYEKKVMDKATKLDMPILGICRGNQMINVYFGGTLYQDVTLKDQNVIQHLQLGSRGKGCQFIDIEEGSLLYSVLGKKGYVNSYHHQSIDQLAPNFKVTATAVDGIIEGIEHVSKKIYGVQFHPEVTHYEDELMLNIFKEFIDRI
ncbi:gamma-glutamyl-gamma-aminobutyrate hydrolase family protein [Beduini massiliensis]|uniref:gamma-glutamyl-gamma-aminobutyrate hydrolase family protein n=1 Tax=Beduini massiliensis TaxID=1585974 RepID=UPI00059AB56A|nr:gamma-glutamyl-gamma-aminobutyrate hydrolase family protein [Beduini massiliensis]